MAEGYGGGTLCERVILAVVHRIDIFFFILAVCASVCVLLKMCCVLML